ncbi:MAG TPA: hypothetical protein VF062_01090 [Candidatus Limnocylindrales bacterium]
MTLRRVILTVLLVAATSLTAATVPAQAAVPDRWAFGFMHDPVPPAATLLDPLRQWKSDNVPNATVTISGFGRYQVKFPNIASLNGIAHVTAVADDARFCQVFRVFTSFADQIVEVQCYKHAAFPAPDWSRFSVMYSTSSGFPLFGGAHAYVRGNLNGGFSSSFNSAGLGNSVIWGGPGTGTYKVHLAGMSTGLFDGNIQVTAEHPNSPRRCKVELWHPGAAGQDILVLCYDQAGAPADTWFNLSYHRERAVFGALAPPKSFAYLWTPGFPGTPSNFNSAGSINTITVTGPGQNMVEFHKVGFKETHVQVTTFRNGASYCNLQAPWAVLGATVVVRNVICFDAAGVQQPNDYFISYSSRI